MLISLLSPLSSDTHRDCFNALLRSAFAVGCEAGKGAMAKEFADVILTHRGRRTE